MINQSNTQIKKYNKNIFENSQMQDHRGSSNSRINQLNHQNLNTHKPPNPTTNNRLFFVHQKKLSPRLYPTEIGIPLEPLCNQKLELNNNSPQEIFEQRQAFDKLIKEKMNKLRHLVNERKSYLKEMEELNSLMEEAIQHHKTDIKFDTARGTEHIQFKQRHANQHQSPCPPE